MFRQLLFVFFINIQLVKSFNDDDDEQSKKLALESEFEPVNPLQSITETIEVLTPDVPCHNFTSYTRICHIEAALMYNSSRGRPPRPENISDWCRAISHLTECAALWNTECSDVSDSLFDEDSIKGHEYVVKNICANDWFLARYAEITTCIANTSDLWDQCYKGFKKVLDSYQDSNVPLTHYDTHFHLCCARAQFRRCTLEASLNASCSQEQTFTLQKFSVVLSEGDVPQNCDQYITYEECPGGDPRPKSNVLLQLQQLSRKARSAPAAPAAGAVDRPVMVRVLPMIVSSLRVLWD